MDNTHPKAKKENFPVTPPFVTSDKRAFIAALYTFCRMVDDVVDHPSLDSTQKSQVISPLITDIQKQHSLHPQLQPLLILMQSHGVLTDPLLRLLQGLERDINLRICQSWSDLYLSAQYTAAPVGEMFLMAYKESIDLKPMAVSLCIAMQTANHLQDIKRDYDVLGRLYIPNIWFTQNGVSVDDLARNKSSKGLKKIYQQTTDKIFDLLKQAKPLLKAIQNKELRRIVKMAYYLSIRLTKKLERADILKKRPTLSRFDYAIAYGRSAL